MGNLEDFDRNPQQPRDEPEPERCVCLPLRRALPRSLERKVVSREGARRLRHRAQALWRSEEHTSELQSPDTISYAVFCLKKKKKKKKKKYNTSYTKK